MENQDIIVGLIILVIIYITFSCACSHYNSYLTNKSNVKIMLFHRPDCGFCKRLEPEWNKFEGMASDIIIEKINIYENPDMTNKFNINGVPTIIAMKNDQRYDYDGDRSAESILAFAKSF